LNADGATKPIKLQRVCEIPSIHAPVTAADISADGKRVAILTVLGPYLFDIPDGDPASLATAPDRHCHYIDPHMEAVCFVKEGLLVTTEARDVFLFKDEHFTRAAPATTPAAPARPTSQPTRTAKRR
jgi:hypothetical protein